MVKNNKGWTEVVEAFLSVTILIALLIVLISEEDSQGDFDSGIYEKEFVLLQSIEINDTLREEVLNIDDENLPVSWNDTSFPSLLKDEMILGMPDYLNCSVKICSIEGSCLIDEYLKTDIYSRSIGIFSSGSEYNPRQLKIFCWEEGDLNLRAPREGEGIHCGDGNCDDDEDSTNCPDDCSTTPKEEEGEGFAYYDISGVKVASFKYNGDIILAGSCTSGGSCSSAPGESFTINGGSGVVAYIDSSGNLCVSSGSCSVSSANCDSPVGNSFRIKNSNGDNVIYIDSNGELCFIGTLTQKGTP